MKTLVLIIFAISVFSATAQNNIILKFNHLLDGKPFAPNELVNSFDGKSVFNYSLLRYYISNIKITHDGGKITEAKGVYLLVNVAYPSIITETNDRFALGKYDINSVETIEFSIGIDEPTNHLDPATYPSSSPLSPQNPSMHWGWTTGYRFVVLEGKAGNTSETATNVFQIHSVGDQLYTTIKLKTKSQIIENGDLGILIDAEYKNLIKNIDVSTGMIEHGSDEVPTTMMKNIGGSVFSASVVNSLQEETPQIPVKMYPNPVHNNLIVSMNNAFNGDIIITNTLGEDVLKTTLSDGKSFIGLTMLPIGSYFVRIMQSGTMIAGNRIIVVR